MTLIQDADISENRGTDKAKVLEILSNTVVGKKTEAVERHNYAVSLKKLHALSNILRDQGYQVSFQKVADRKVQQNNTFVMTYLGNPIFGFKTKGVNDEFVQEFPLKAYVYHSSVSDFAKKRVEILMDGFAQKRAEALLITEKSDDGEAVIRARNSITNIEAGEKTAEEKVGKFDDLKKSMFRTLWREIAKGEEQLDVKNEEELVSLISRVVSICKNYEDKGLFTISNTYVKTVEKPEDETGKAVYERQILGSLYNPSKVTTQLIYYPVPKIK